MNHYTALGGWSWAMQPYYDEELSRGLAAPFVEDFVYLLDPYGEYISYDGCGV